MRLRIAPQLVLVLLAAAASSGCEQGREAPPKTLVRVVNAAPTHPSLNFVRVRRTEVSELGYGAASGQLSFDVDSYDFRVDIVPPGASAGSAVGSFAAELQANVEYTFVLVEGATGGIEPITIEAASGAGELTVVHAGVGLPPLDVYLEAAGADLSTATPLGRVSFGQAAPAASRTSGEYRITVTESGDPSAVLLASPAVSIDGSRNGVVVVLAGVGEGTAPIRVLLAQDNPVTLLDTSVQSALRIVNAAADEAARDAALGEQLSPPLIAAVPFGTASAYADVPGGEHTLSIMPAGNPGVVDGTGTLTLANGRMYTAIVSGAPGHVTVAPLLDDPRRLFDRAQLALYNGANQFSSLYFYVLLPGTDPATASPAASLAAPGGTQYVGLPPGDYEIVVRNPDLQTVGGPIPITVAAGGIYAILAVNGADAASASLVPLDDFVAAP